MSALAQEHGAVNLGQGFPDFDCDPALLDARRRGDARRPEPVPADGRRAGAARGASPRRSRRSTAIATTRRREITITAGATQAILTAVLAFVAPGRRGDRPRARATTATRPNIELAGGRVGARAARCPARFAPDFEPHRRRARRRGRARSSSTRRTTRAARSGRPTTCARLAELLRADRRARASPTRSTSTWCFDGARTRAWRASRARGAQLRRLELRQDLPRDRLEGRLRGRAGGADGRVPQGAPVQRVHRQHADAARPRGATWPTRRTTSTLPAFYAPSATGSAPASPTTRLRLLPCEGTYFQCVDYSAVERLGDDALLPLADERDRRRGDPAVGVLRRRLRPAHRALLLRQEGRDARPRAGSPALALERPAARCRVTQFLAWEGPCPALRAHLP